MTKQLKKRIKKVLITLKPSSGYTWKQEADDMIEEYNRRTVTTALK